MPHLDWFWVWVGTCTTALILFLFLMAHVGELKTRATQLEKQLLYDISSVNLMTDAKAAVDDLTMWLTKNTLEKFEEIPEIDAIRLNLQESLEKVTITFREAPHVRH